MDGVAAYWAKLGSRTLAPKVINMTKAWGGFAEALAFYEPRGSVHDFEVLPSFKVYSHVNVAIFRSPWTATKQIYISIKGGNTSWNHAHLDLGR